MKEGGPSATALRVAMRRAAHQVLDDPRVFDDPLALRIVGAEDVPEPRPDPAWAERSSPARGLRAFLAARCRYAEDELRVAVGRGTRQYVVLGAGLDTFACRNPYPADVLRVFEVDHPATQSWKRARLEDAGIAIPGTLTFAPVDLERVTLEEGLRAGEPFVTFFDPSSLERTLGDFGFGGVVHMGHAEINARYFEGRADALRVGSLADLVSARV
ncbi:MAG: class I SAM-dependent methyltransferase [Gemmatimonadota bacterium]